MRRKRHRLTPEQKAMYKHFKNWEIHCINAKYSLDVGEAPKLELTFRIAHEGGNWFRRDATEKSLKVVKEILFPPYKFKVKDLLRLDDGNE